MPLLERTSLNPSDKPDFVRRAVACQAWGDISRLSFEFNVSRNTIGKVRALGLESLTELLETSYEQKLTVDSAQIDRAIVALSITAPNSIRAIEDLIPLIYPKVTRSFGYIQGLLKKAQANAATFNAQVDLSGIKSAAIDETFCQNEPVLAGIDLDSGFLALLSHEIHRDGETWARVLNNAKAQGMVLSHVVKDGALAMTCAVNAVYPDAEQRDDIFHAKYIASKAVNKTEKRAYRLITVEEAAEKALAKALRKLQQNTKAPKKKKVTEDEEKQLKQNVKLAKKAFGKAQKACAKAIERYEYAQKSLNYLHKALNCVHTNIIALMSPDAARSLLMLSAHYLKEACHPECDDAARYLENRLEGLTLATTQCYEKQLALCKEFPEDLVALACYFFENERRLKKVSKDNRLEVQQKMAAAYHHIRTKLSEHEVDALMSKAREVLDKRHRASSAIEGFNAILRPYMYVRKGVDQGFLELFMAWHNLRTRRSGKHKGTSAYETLTGMPVDDWLTIIGFPQSKTLH